MRRMSIPAILLIMATAWLAPAAKPFAAETPAPEWLKNAEERLLAARPVTRPPHAHFFAYFDVLQFDPSGRYALCMAAPFEFRMPTATDACTIGVIDLKDDDRWTTLGTTTAWSWQQGCRLQWRPGSDREVLWNDRADGRFVCRVLDVKTKKRRTLPMAIECVSPDGKWALAADFARIAHLRPSCGYAGIEDPYNEDPAPRQLGAWKIDIDTGKAAMLISLADVAALPSPGYDPAKGRPHYLNHFSVSPDGKRFLFLNRGGVDRMLVADADGRNLRFICNAPSHFCWKDSETILCWTKDAYRFYKADGSSGPSGKVLFKAPNGHQSYLPGGEWLLTDTYPQGKERRQYLYLHNLKSGAKVVIGKFPTPEAYGKKEGGETVYRCDLHPRLSPDGTRVMIDSPHQGGRQMYLLDISAIVGRKTN